MATRDRASVSAPNSTKPGWTGLDQGKPQAAGFFCRKSAFDSTRARATAASTRIAATGRSHRNDSFAESALCKRKLIDCSMDRHLPDRLPFFFVASHRFHRRFAADKRLTLQHNTPPTVLHRVHQGLLDIIPASPLKRQLRIFCDASSASTVSPSLFLATTLRSGYFQSAVSIQQLCPDATSLLTRPPCVQSLSIVQQVGLAGNHPPPRSCHCMLDSLARHHLRL